jgi:hypothetical protein
MATKKIKAELHGDRYMRLIVSEDQRLPAKVDAELGITCKAHCKCVGGVYSAFSMVRGNYKL